MLDLYEFETVAEAPVEAVPAGDEPSSDAAEVATEPGATGEEDPPSSPATETAPAWDANDPAFRDAIRQEAEALVQAQLAGLQQEATSSDEPEPISLDPFDENFGTNLQKMLRAELAQISQPLQAQQEAARNAEGEQRIQDMIADDLTRNGDLSDAGKAQVRPLVNVFFGEFAEVYGPSSKAVELATQKAAAAVRQIEKNAETRAVERYKNELGTLSGAPTELGAGPTGGAVGASGLDPARTIQEVVERNAGKLQALRTN